MDRHPQPASPSKQLFLRVPQVQHRVRQYIAPVILEQRCLRMLDQSPTGQPPSTSTTTTATATAATATATVTATATTLSSTSVPTTATSALTSATSALTSAATPIVTASTIAIPTPSIRRRRDDAKARDISAPSTTHPPTATPTTTTTTTATIVAPAISPTETAAIAALAAKASPLPSRTAASSRRIKTSDGVADAAGKTAAVTSTATDSTDATVIATASGRPRLSGEVGIPPASAAPSKTSPSPPPPPPPAARSGTSAISKKPTSKTSPALPSSAKPSTAEPPSRVSPAALTPVEKTTATAAAALLADDGEHTSTDIVGRKRPTGEARPQIVLSQPSNGEGEGDDEGSEQRKQQQQQQQQQHREKTSDTWESEFSRRRKAQLPSATTTSKLSTREHAQTRDQQQQQPQPQPYRERSHSEGRPSVQFSLAPAKRDEAHIMEFFQEQEKNLQKSFLSLPSKAPRKQRSPSPRAQPNIGLEHLDNLVRLMQQLTSLKDENVRLRKRCDFLESTKVLLEAKRELSPEGDSLPSTPPPSGVMTLPARQKQHHHQQQFHFHHHHHQPPPPSHHHHHPHPPHHHPHRPDHPHQQHQQRERRLHDSAAAAITRSRQATTTFTAPPLGDGRRTRPRLSSAEEFQMLEAATCSSDQRVKPAKKKALHKRSFSTGSLGVPAEILLEGMDPTEDADGDKAGKSKDPGAKQASKQKSTKSSKWARVKKVLTGQKLYEDLGTTIRSLRDFGRSSQMRYSDTGGPPSACSDVMSGSAHESSSETGRPSLESSSDSSKRPAAFVISKPSDVPSLEEGPADAADDLTTDIWMGPPDWWEEYEASRESAPGSVDSDVGSVIEVTTLYLGANRKDPMSTSQTTTASATSATSATSSTSTPPELRLQVEKFLARRRSSPSLSLHDAADDKSLLEECATKTEPVRLLHKSSSCKSADIDLPKETLFGHKDGGKEAKKAHRKAWDRVKDIIIHTRKDSMKRKSRKEKSGLLTEPEESSEIDMEAFLDDQWGTEFFAEGLLSRSTPKTSPMIIRQQPQTGKAPDVEPAASGAKGPSVMSKSGPSPGTFSSGTFDMAALLGQSMSEDFNKKMQQWEEMKSKKSSSLRASIEESDVGSFDISQSSQDFPLRTVDLKDLGGSIPEATSESLTTEDTNTSTETQGAGHSHGDGVSKKMTDSFSRKMLEWEKRKSKGSPVPLREPSPDMERKGSKGRKDDRQKSKRSREDKEKEKLEKQREREMQKVEREQVKLEKEKLRIEKERLRALEREAKLEKLKGRLSQSDSESSFRNPVLSPLAEYKVTADFARKLHEWELRKGLSHDMSNSMYLEAQKMKMHQTKDEPSQEPQAQQRLSPARPASPRPSYDDDGGQRGGPPEGAEGGGEKSPPSPYGLQPFWDGPEDAASSPVEKYSDLSQGEETSVTEECKTTANIPSLERANAQLLQELRKKEAEYAAVQEEVQLLNIRLSKVRQDHATEMARYHQDVAQGTPAQPVKLEVGELETSMVDLEEKIKVMENFGQRLAVSMESAAVGKWQSIEGEDTVHTQLVDLVGQMRSMLVQATQSEEASQKTSALSNFETLYSQAMKLQVEMNNLRLSHLERNREILVIKRQLLLQEVNNLLLQADISRRETELYQFQEAKRFSSLKKWNTFGGTDRTRPQGQSQLETPPSILVKGQAKPSTSSKPSVGKNSVEFSELPSAPATKSAPTSSLVKLPEDRSVATPSSASGGKPDLQETQSLAERSTDHRETHLLSPVSAKRQKGPSAPRREPAVDGSLPLPPGTKTPDTAPPALSLRLPVLSRDNLALDPSAATPQTFEAAGSPRPSAVVLQLPSSASILPAKALPSESARTTTSYDSEPIHRQLEALKIARSKVGTGSPALIERKKDGRDPAPAPSPGPGAGRLESTPETPHQDIPPQQQSPSTRPGKPRPHGVAATLIDDDNISLPAQSVIECTDLPSISDNRTVQIQQPAATATPVPAAATWSSLEGGSAVLPPAQTTASPTSSVPLSTLPPISDQARAGSRSPRSPVAKQKLLRRQQKDDRDGKLKEYTAVSPKGSPVAARGKPPLPRQNTPVRHSPSPSPSRSEKGARSKSHGDVDTVAPASPTLSPLHDAINKFEKRATVCETEDRPIELRKTPSPTLHLPRVGLVSRVRKLKPAAELLEESQRYRSGQSIYATRILQKYLPKEDAAKAAESQQQRSSHNKENVSGSYVHAMVQRLSRETTPIRSGASSRTNSNGSLHWPDSPRTQQSELVSHIVKKFSSPGGPENQQPLSDRTNGVQIMKETNGYHPDEDGSERSASQPGLTEHGVIPRIPSTSSAAPSKSVKKQHRRSCEVAEVLSSASISPTELSLPATTSMSTGSIAVIDDRSHLSDTAASGPTNHKSLPALSSTDQKTSLKERRERAATCSDPERGKPRFFGAEDVEGEIESEYSSQASGSSPAVGREGGKKPAAKARPKRDVSKSARSKSEGRKFPSSLSPIRRGRLVEGEKGKMETVGVLCKQSISFDLGVSLYARDEGRASDSAPSSQPRKPRSWDPSESAALEAAHDLAVALTQATTSTTWTPSSSPSSPAAGAAVERAEGGYTSGDAEGEFASPPSSPPPPSSSSSEKKRSRRFLDANWLQRSKRFFKVNK